MSYATMYRVPAFTLRSASEALLECLPVTAVLGPSAQGIGPFQLGPNICRTLSRLRYMVPSVGMTWKTAAVRVGGSLCWCAPNGTTQCFLRPYICPCAPPPQLQCVGALPWPGGWCSNCDPPHIMWSFCPNSYTGPAHPWGKMRQPPQVVGFTGAADPNVDLYFHLVPDVQLQTHPFLLWLPQGPKCLEPALVLHFETPSKKSTLIEDACSFRNAILEEISQVRKNPSYSILPKLSFYSH